jgi:hypothetical protein
MTEKFVIPEEAPVHVKDPSEDLKTPAPFVPMYIVADEVGSTAIDRIAPTPSGPRETQVADGAAAKTDAATRNAAQARKVDRVFRRSGIVRVQP